MRLRGLVVAAAAVMLGLTACQGDPPESTRVAEPAPTTTLPPVDASYWSTVPQTDEQRAEVSARARLIDVCALVPRAELVTLGEVRNVDNDETDSCRVELGPSDSVEKLSWASMVAFGDAAPPGASVQQLGDVALSVLLEDPGTSTTERTCNATAKFRSGAAIYFKATTSPTTDACARLETMAPGAVRRWLTAPPHGTSPDTRRSVLNGADPCAVRARLDGTGPFGVPVLTSCGFTYRGDDVVVSFENRERPTLSKTTAQMPDGRTAHVVDGTSYTVVVGPEFAGETSYFGASAPAVNVFADTPEVAEDVMRHVLTLFPAT
ncbi:peptidase [Nocardia salmonicida]|uniref:peptidase n=1 Tax=Nocardia salmonicida TaxID=53431 RepID=UPI00378EE63C